MSGQKRAFPYHSAVNPIQLQGRRVSEDPSREYVEPRVFQAREHSEYDELEAHMAGGGAGTDFGGWNDAEIRAFLDQRGEDYDDCPDRDALVKRAQECEANTGPAVKPAGGGAAQQAAAAGEEDEMDPLDAFMAEIHTLEAAAGTAGAAGGQGAGAGPGGGGQPAAKKPRRGIELDEEDHLTDFLEARRQAGTAAAAAAAAAAAGGDGYGSDEEVYATAKALEAAGGEYDADDQLIVAGGKRQIEALAALDHGSQEYDEFAKDFYDEAPEVFAMDDKEVAEYRRSLGIRVSGFDAPKPIKLFAHCGFDAPLAAAVARAGYERPTAIQAQALPAALSGRDVLGIAKTGSGKTAAFVLPMVVHIMDQPELGKGEGPIAVIVAPTRELAEQIHKEARRFSKPYNLNVCAAFGGLSKHTQFKELKAGAEVAVCTPGRMIDLIKMKACTMRRATYLVFDEADRMFDMGFEPQVRSIMGQIRPDRQTLLFSATMPRRVERLAADALTSPVRVTVGEVGGANEDIKQVVEVLDSGEGKLRWLLSRIGGFVDGGDVLVFANQKARVEEVLAALNAQGQIRAAAIHGDMDQHTRMEVLHGFKAGRFHALVATDVAARGLDIKSIKTVINFDAAKDIDTHVHRIGRTGRAGDKEGVAYTLVLPNEARTAGDLVQCLTAAGQEVPKPLQDLAARDPRFRRGLARGKGGGRGGGGRGGGRRKAQVGGAGLGFGDDGPSRPPGGFPAAAPRAGFAPAAAAAAAAAPAPAAGGGLAGFARSHGGADTHFATGGSSEADQAAVAAAAAGFAGRGEGPPGGAPAAAAPSGFAPAAAPAPAGGSGGYAGQSEATQQQQQQQPPLPSQPPLPPQAPQQPAQWQQQQAAAAAEAASDWGQARRTAYSGQFRNAFVSSGTRQGDIDAKPEIVMPKQPRQAQAVPPPPIPVTQVPLYLRQQQPQQRFGAGAAGGGGGFAAAQQTAAQAAAVAQAQAAAAAIAARLAAQAPGGAGLPQAAAAPPTTAAAAAAAAPAVFSAAPAPAAQPPPAASAAQMDEVQQKIAQAQAIAARLAAQAGGGGGGGGAGAGADPNQWQWGGGGR